MSELKVQMFIQKLNESTDIAEDSDLAKATRKATESTLGASNSLANAIPLLSSRRLQTVAILKKASWSDLGLEKPKLSNVEVLEITELTVEQI